MTYRIFCAERKGQYKKNVYLLVILKGGKLSTFYFMADILEVGIVKEFLAGSGYSGTTEEMPFFYLKEDSFRGLVDADQLLSSLAQFLRI